MEKLVVKANAKINLTLDVIGKREDGYHLLDMVMHSVGIYDEITIKKNYENNIKVSCDNNSLEIDEMNSAFKAAKLIMEEKEFSGVAYRDWGCIFLKKNEGISGELCRAT